MIRTFKAKIHGKTPILMNKFYFGKKLEGPGVDDGEDLADLGITKPIAELATYRDKNGSLIVPRNNLYLGAHQRRQEEQEG